MRIGINAGFGETLQHEYAGLSQLGFTDIRQDLQRCTQPQAEQLLAEGRKSTLRHLYVVTLSQLALLRPGERAELWNEPDLNHITPEAYVDAWVKYAQPALDRGVRVYASAISNLNARGFAWLRRAYELFPVPPLFVSVHRYPDKTAQNPHLPFPSRDAEVVALRRLIGDASIAVTEMGYHSALRWRWKILPTRWNDREVAENLRYEWQFWSTQINVDTVYVYQLNDGPSWSAVDRYGIRRQNNTWKPAAFAHQFFTKG